MLSGTITGREKGKFLKNISQPCEDPTYFQKSRDVTLEYTQRKHTVVAYYFVSLQMNSLQVFQGN